MGWKAAGSEAGALAAAETPHLPGVEEGSVVV